MRTLKRAQVVHKQWMSNFSTVADAMPTETFRFAFEGRLTCS